MPEVIDRCLQRCDVASVFVVGASAFPQNLGYNPTAFVGALVCWSAEAIRERCLKIPKVLA